MTTYRRNVRRSDLERSTPLGTTTRRAVALAALVGSLVAVSASSADTSTVFVIGDGNAALGTHVTFWGAQWAKDNTVTER